MHLPGYILSCTSRVPFQSSTMFESSLLALTCKHSVASEKAAKVCAPTTSSVPTDGQATKNEPASTASYFSHSYRSATIGSTFIALRAGAHDAARTTIVSNAAADR